MDFLKKVAKRFKKDNGFIQKVDTKTIVRRLSVNITLNTTQLLIQRNPIIGKHFETDDEEYIARTLQKFEPQRLMKGTMILRKDYFSKEVFLLLKGEVIIPNNITKNTHKSIKRRYLHKFKPNDLIGHLEAVYSIQRPFNVVCATNVEVLKISTNRFSRLFRETVERYYADKLDFLKNNFLLKQWKYEYLVGMLHFLGTLKMNLNNHVYEIGDKDDRVYFVKKGQVMIQALTDRRDLIPKKDEDVGGFRDKSQSDVVFDFMSRKRKIKSKVSVTITKIDQGGIFGIEEGFGRGSAVKKFRAVCSCFDTELYYFSRNGLLSYNDFAKNPLNTLEEYSKLIQDQRVDRTDRLVHNRGISLDLKKSQIRDCHVDFVKDKRYEDISFIFKNKDKILNQYIVNKCRYVKDYQTDKNYRVLIKAARSASVGGLYPTSASTYSEDPGHSPDPNKTTDRFLRRSIFARGITKSEKILAQLGVKPEIKKQLLGQKFAKKEKNRNEDDTIGYCTTNKMSRTMKRTRMEKAEKESKKYLKHYFKKEGDGYGLLGFRKLKAFCKYKSQNTLQTPKIEEPRLSLKRTSMLARTQIDLDKRFRSKIAHSEDKRGGLGLRWNPSEEILRDLGSSKERTITDSAFDVSIMRNSFGGPYQPIQRNNSDKISSKVLERLKMSKTVYSRKSTFQHKTANELGVDGPFFIKKGHRTRQALNRIQRRKRDLEISGIVHEVNDSEEGLRIKNSLQKASKISRNRTKASMDKALMHIEGLRVSQEVEALKKVKNVDKLAEKAAEEKNRLFLEKVRLSTHHSDMLRRSFQGRKVGRIIGAKTKMRRMALDGFFSPKKKGEKAQIAEDFVEE